MIRPADYARALHAELGKLRGSRTLVTALYGPIILIVITFFATIFAEGSAPEPRGWVEFTNDIFAFYMILLFPILTAMIGAQLGSIEHGPNMWKSLYAMPQPRYATVFAKLVFASGLTLGAYFVAAFGSIAVAVCVSMTRSDISMPIVGDAPGVALLCLELWIASLLAIAIHTITGLWVRKTMLAVGLGVVGMFSSFIGMINQVENVRFSPWFLPLNRLGDGGMVPGEVGPLTLGAVAAISVVGALVVAGVGGVQFTRRDVP